MKKYTTKQKVVGAFAGLCCMLTLTLAPISYTSDTPRIQKAEAQWAVVVVEDIPFDLKELVWDTLQYVLVNKVLSDTVKEVLGWVQTGYGGDPAFVTNLEQFMLDVNDQRARELIYGSELSGLLPSQEQAVRQILAAEYFEQERDFAGLMESTLGESSDDPEAFINGNFFAGGWDAFYSMTQRGNNSFSALNRARTELTRRQELSQDSQQQQLGWGQGFHPACEEINGVLCEKLITPAVMVQAATEYSSVDVPLGRLVDADEIKEFLALFASGLADSLLGGEGLAGVSSDDFVNQLLAAVPIIEENWVAPERRYLAIVQAALGAIEALEQYAIEKCGQRTPPSLPSGLASWKRTLEVLEAESLSHLAQFNAVIDAAQNDTEIDIVEATDGFPAPRRDQEMEELREQVQSHEIDLQNYRGLIDSQCEIGGSR